MKDDIPPAAFRLLSSLPVRKHEAVLKPHLKNNNPNHKIIIGGVKYDSIRDVKKKLHVARSTIDKWLLEGKAKRG